MGWDFHRHSAIQKADPTWRCQDKEVVVDMTQSLDGEEAAAVVEDLVKADAMQWDMKLGSAGDRCRGASGFSTQKWGR